MHDFWLVVTVNDHLGYNITHEANLNTLVMDLAVVVIEILWVSNFGILALLANKTLAAELDWKVVIAVDKLLALGALELLFHLTNFINLINQLFTGLNCSN